VPPYDSAPHDAVHSLIEEFARVAPRVRASADFDDSLTRITGTAVTAVKGCESASISLLDKGRPVTRGATDRLAFDGDQIQYDEGEGPCLDAALQGLWVYEPDLAADVRWPRSSRRIAELGVTSMFSCRLALEAAPNHTLGGLNLYATKRDAFSEQDQMLAILLASLGAVVVDAARQQQHLRAAIASRQVIGEAIGILRAQNNLSSQQAFEMLSKASQRTNTKLRDLAQRISDGSRTGRDQSPKPGLGHARR
jgi:transcriptional regulator with GAF, ATPase, and Fis domain